MLKGLKFKICALHLEAHRNGELLLWKNHGMPKNVSPYLILPVLRMYNQNSKTVAREYILIS